MLQYRKTSCHPTLNAPLHHKVHSSSLAAAPSPVWSVFWEMFLPNLTEKRPMEIQLKIHFHGGFTLFSLCLQLFVSKTRPEESLPRFPHSRSTVACCCQIIERCTCCKTTAFALLSLSFVYIAPHCANSDLFVFAGWQITLYLSVSLHPFPLCNQQHMGAEFWSVRTLRLSSAPQTRHNITVTCDQLHQSEVV